MWEVRTFRNNEPEHLVGNRFATFTDAANALVTDLVDQKRFIGCELSPQDDGWEDFSHFRSIVSSMPREWSEKSLYDFMKHDNDSTFETEWDYSICCVFV